MYIPYQFMTAMEDDRLRTAERDGQAAAVRRERRRLRSARREQRTGWRDRRRACRAPGI